MVAPIRRGFGQSAFLGIGGDPIVGTTFTHALRGFEADEETDAVVLVGEIGGTMEEDAAPVVAEMGIPVVAFIAGACAPEGRRTGHAGAIVAGDKGTARSKKTARGKPAHGLRRSLPRSGSYLRISELRSVDEATHSDVQDQPETNERRHHRGSPVAYQREWESLDGNQASHHSHVV